MKLIKRHNSWEKTESFKGVIRIIVDSMFENVVNDEFAQKDILKLLQKVIRTIIDEKNDI